MTPYDGPPPVSPTRGEPGSPASPRKGSGSEKRRRNHKLDTRWDDREYAALLEKASAAGFHPAPYLRALALGTPGPRAQRRPHIDFKELAKAIAAVNKSGNVLNQIARSLNAGAPTAFGREFSAALAANRAAAAAIREIVGRKNRDDSEGQSA